MNLFSIPTGTPFLPILRDRLLDGTLAGPFGAADWAAATIFLPSRRSARAFADLLAAEAGRAAVLPRIVPLGDADEEGAEPACALPPAVPPLERRLVLTRLVQAWAAAASRAAREAGTPRVLPDRPADAVGLAADLEALMDSIATEGARWEDVADLVETEHSAYFAETLRFLRIADEFWPAFLDARGASDPVRRRDAALDAEAARLLASPPAGPVIAAGSTGSVPATARLLGAIARLPRGAVVLPGLDYDLDEAGWAAIGAPEGETHGHPQFLLRRLLFEHLGLDRGAVRRLDAAGRAPPRRRLLSAIMRPAETTDAWADLPTAERQDLAATGTDGIALVEAADEREEALAIALAIRETLERPAATAALVTPHRGLAHRVAAELGRWGIVAADSAGIALAETGPGRLARLAADAAASDFEPVATLALLAHPDVRLGLARSEIEAATAALEIGALRGPAPRPGLDGIADALALRRRETGRRVPEPRRRLAEADWDRAADLLKRLDGAFAGFGAGRMAANTILPPRHAEERPEGASRSTHDRDACFETARAAPPQHDGVGSVPIAPEPARELDLVALASRHREAVAALIRPPVGEPPRNPAGLALDTLFDDLALTRVEDGEGRSVRGRFADYPAFFVALARTVTLAPQETGMHPRVQILGLLEARLLDADRIVLGGLDETIWPPVAETGPFLNRPMRIKLGLSPPERRVGQTAHDFVQALGHPDAVVTRSRKRDGKPTVPSRFLERLRAFGGPEAWRAMTGRGERYRRLATVIDRPRAVPPARRPEPRPGGVHFPRGLSVTEIETLVRDPYAIYARHVLRLEPLDAVALLPGAADRGTMIHDTLADFVAAYPDEIGPDAADRMRDFGAERFRPIAATYPELHALWWPAFERLVPAYLAWERGRRSAGVALHVERSGELVVPLGPDDAFRLRGRADRIEIGPAGSAIVDFKTGSVPTDEVVAVGFSPQLTLEAAMLQEGGFADIGPVPGLAELDYVKIGGRAVLATHRLKPPKGDSRPMAEIVATHRRGLEETVRRYVAGSAGYVSRPYAQYARRYAPYDHLARVKEWSALAGEGGE